MDGTTKIYASALIYGRTYGRDYDSNFLLKPEDFSMEDIQWARKYVLESVSCCEDMEGIRRVVFGNEKYLVFGISGIINTILERNLFSEEKNLYQEYAFDRNGRNIKCFLGLVCHMGEKRRGDSIQLTEKEFLTPYLEKVAKKELWYSGDRQNQRAEYAYPFILYDGQNGEKPQEDVMVSEEAADEELFFQVLSMNWAGRKTASLCTNMYNLKMVEKKLFDYATAGANTVKQYQKKTAQPQDGNIAGIEEVHENDAQASGNKRRNVLMALIAAGGITAVIIILLLVTQGQRKKEEQRTVGTIYDEFYKGEELESTNYTLRELFESQKKYAALVREYKPEIEYIQGCLKDLREEEKAFYEKELPEILEILKKEDVNEASRKEWMEKLQDSMAKSYKMSEDLLNDLAIKQVDEFRRAAEEIIRGGALV